jgi:hypothetical protein
MAKLPAFDLILIKCIALSLLILLNRFPLFAMKLTHFMMYIDEKNSAFLKLHTDFFEREKLL